MSVPRCTVFDTAGGVFPAFAPRSRDSPAPHRRGLERLPDLESFWNQSEDYPRLETWTRPALGDWSNWASWTTARDLSAVRRHASGRGGICVLTRAVSGRRLHRPDASHLPDADLSGQAVCAPHRAGTPSCVPRAWDGTLEGLDRAADRMCRIGGVLESLAVRFSPARTRPEASTSNRTPAVAERRRRCLPAPVTPWPDPLGWLPGHEPRSEAPVRVCAIHVHEHLSGHPPNLP